MYVKRVPFKEKIPLKIQMCILKYIQNLHKSIIPENKQNKSYIYYLYKNHAHPCHYFTNASHTLHNGPGWLLSYKCGKAAIFAIENE